MTLDRKPRHWFALLLAVIVTCVALSDFLDFAPGWMDRRSPLLPALLGLMVITITLNLVLDRRQAGP